MATAKQRRDQRAAETATKTEVEALNERQFQDPSSATSAHGEVVRSPKSGRTVIVACKLGVRAFQMQLCQVVEKFQQDMQGGRYVKEAIRVGDVVEIRGTAYPRGTPPKGFPPAPLIVDGAALNFGIDADFFEKWLKQNELNPIVMNRMVFAHESRDHVEGVAREMKNEKSGLDPIDPGDRNDPRLPRSGRKGEVSEIEPGVR